MKKIILAAAAASMAFAGPVLAAEKTDLDGLKTPAGKVIGDYFKMFFTECNRAGANAKYYAKDAKEHGWLGNGAVEPSEGKPGAAGANAMGAAPQGAGAPPAGAGAPPSGATPQGAGGPPAGTPPEGGAAGGKCEPNADMIKMVVQGDLVFVQAHGKQSKPNGDLLWILYRVKDGKIVEHWDTHNEIPDSQAGKQW